MASHSKDIKLMFLQNFNTAVTTFCVLGNSPFEDALESTSDLDLAVAIEPSLLWGKMKNYPGFPFSLICKWEYDHGCFSTFWLNLDTDEIAQVDFMMPHKFANRLGINPIKVVERKIQKNGVPINNNEDAQIYRHLKSIVKNTKASLDYKQNSGNEIDYCNSYIIRRKKFYIFNSRSKPKPIPWKLRKILIFSEGIFSGRLLKRVLDKPGFCIRVTKQFYLENMDQLQKIIEVFPRQRIRDCKGNSEPILSLLYLQLTPSIMIVICDHETHFSIENEHELSTFFCARSRSLLG